MTLCNITALQPPGILNTANNCYSSSVLQCLLNHPIFFELFQLSKGRDNCETCQKSGNLLTNYIYIYNYIYYIYTYINIESL